MDRVGPMTAQCRRQQANPVESSRLDTMVDDLDALVSEWPSKGAESIQRVHAHVGALAVLVLCQGHDEAFRATHLQVVEDMIDAHHSATIAVTPCFLRRPARAAVRRV
jgi:hypothetical protein